MTNMDFASELSRLREMRASPEAYDIFRRDLMEAIAKSKVAAEARAQAQAAALSRIEALKAERVTRPEAQPLGGDLRSGLLELLDPVTFRCWLDHATPLEDSITAPERLVEQIGRLRDFIYQIETDMPKLKVLLSLPLADAGYRAELEKLIPLDHRLRQLLSSPTRPDCE
jgi:hypothetical protein